MYELKSGKSKKTMLFLFVFLLSCLAGPAVLAQGDPAQPEDPPRFRGPGMQMPGMQMPPANGMQGPAGRAGRLGMLRRGIGRQRMAQGQGMGGGGLLRLLRRPDVQKEISLTEDQRKKLEDIAFNASKAGIQERANLQVQRLDLARLMRADNPDRGAIDKKLQEISQAQLVLSRARLNGLLDARGVLSKSQRDKLAQLAQNRLARRVQGQGQPGQQGSPPPEGNAPQRNQAPPAPPSRPPGD